MRHTLVCLFVSLLTLAACGGAAREQGSNPSPASSPASAAAPAEARTVQGQTAVGTQPPRPAFREVTIPAGTELALSLRTRVGSAVSEPGDPIEAVLAHPVMVDGREIVPANASVGGRVVSARPSGRVKGRAALGLTFDRLSIGDRRYDIETTAVRREAEATHKKDALSIGIPAAAGTIIGAIAGGRKGALIGGAAAGGAGTAYVLATPGQDIVLPAGTRLTARLTAPVTLRIPAASSR